MPRAVTVRVPNGLFKDWLTKHYSGVISEAMGECRKSDLAVNFVAEPPADAAAISLGPDESATMARPAPVRAPGPAGLNPRYTFDTFIVGSSNQFAHAA